MAPNAPDAETTEKTSAVTRWIDAAKKHPLIAVPAFALFLFGLVVGAIQAQQQVATWVGAWLEPHAELFDALAQVDLDSTEAYFANNVGEVKSVYDLCEQFAQCPEGYDEDLRLVVHEGEGVTVRAIFEGEQLEFYAITIMEEGITPEMSWLGHDLGKLGEVTFAEAFAVPGLDAPTHALLFMGPQSVAYGEGFAGGAPANYRGLFLGWAPDGYAGEGMSFDLDGASDVQAVTFDLMTAETGEVYGEELARFRAGTTPNTFGEFRDDGGFVAGFVMQEPTRVLYLGTEF
ncbi:ETEC_3214 domain-containing protein [Agromyces sp. SYSU T00194]|uniref:ETEC_3214 domain-containing protein n=1 Tax=Agromyces chitinivorans TaxID=3158560 RepID=UPI00339989A0